MTDLHWTEHIELNFYNCRTKFGYQKASEFMTTEDVLAVLRDKDIAKHLEPAFAKMEIIHHVPFFLEQGERYPARLDLRCQVFFDDKKPTVDTVRNYIGSCLEYKDYAIDWDKLNLLSAEKLKGLVPYVVFVCDRKLSVSHNLHQPIVISPKTLKQVDPVPADDKVAIPGIKRIIDPVRMIRIATEERENYMFNNGYVNIKEH